MANNHNIAIIVIIVFGLAVLYRLSNPPTTPPILHLQDGYIQPYNPKKHPSQMTREELEAEAELNGLGVGPGLVEGNRYRGNLNL